MHFLFGFPVLVFVKFRLYYVEKSIFGRKDIKLSDILHEQSGLPCSRETYFKFYSELEYMKHTYTTYSKLNKFVLEVTVSVKRKVIKQQEILFAG